MLIIFAPIIFTCHKTTQDKPDRYPPTWESLTSHEVPEWLYDAKFGIYAHWGIYSVPAYGSEWYGRLMYDETNPRDVYRHHRETYGGPESFGYREFIPRFKAENFDPDAWADVIRRSGAKYAGIAVVHHDGFGLWDSKVNRWNAGNMGPRRDLYGDLVKSLRSKGVKTIATFHHIRTFNWFLPSDSVKIEQGKHAGWDLFDPIYADFYWNEFTSTEDEFLNVWKGKVREVIDNYRPDVLWFDGGKFQDDVSSEIVLDILSHYYNRSLHWGKDVDVLNKLPVTRQFNFPREFGVLTFEGGRDRPEFVDRPWIDDLNIGIGSWGYVENLKYRSVNEIIDGLVDRVSRNGGMLLSLSPKADGTLPDEQIEILLSIGDWLGVNGEAIYGTRPWRIQAEGSVEKMRSVNRGGHSIWRFTECTSEDIRFTRKEENLYVLFLEWPEHRKVIVQSLSAKEPVGVGGIRSISLLGHEGALVWSRTDEHLIVQLPQEPPCRYAYALRLTVSGSQ